ncbi:MAG: Mg(2+)-transport-ATPase-associated protein MgtC [Firmicutes bacterium]|nr:Mg(2+)-transport-ATPase-associated protein MgtC [Bacillota bacterium]
MLSWQVVLLRVTMAFVLSGIVGMEREFGNRPAGLRTHILVCLGSTLVMLVSFHLFEQYKFETSMDPARLGAQVISGIGFLGAGTILKEGASIRGLTTAAGLWAVACIGLAVGAGFYIGAIMVTAAMVITLTMVTEIEKRLIKRKNNYALTIRAQDKPGQLGLIGSALGNKGISIKNVQMIEVDEGTIEINLLLKLPDRVKGEDVLQLISGVEGVKQIVDAR